MLTQKQEAFALEWFNCGVASDAYRKAYPNKMTDKQIWEEACKLSKEPKVIQRVRELRAETASVVIIDKAYITNGIIKNIIAAEQKDDNSVALKGYDMLSKMYDLNDDKQNDRLFSENERLALYENFKRRMLNVTPMGE